MGLVKENSLSTSDRDLILRLCYDVLRQVAYDFLNQTATAHRLKYMTSVYCNYLSLELCEFGFNSFDYKGLEVVCVNGGVIALSGVLQVHGMHLLHRIS